MSSYGHHNNVLVIWILARTFFLIKLEFGLFNQTEDTDEASIDRPNAILQN